MENVGTGQDVPTTRMGGAIMGFDVTACGFSCGGLTGTCGAVFDAEDGAGPCECRGCLNNSLWCVNKLYNEWNPVIVPVVGCLKVYSLVFGSSRMACASTVLSLVRIHTNKTSCDFEAGVIT